MTIEEAFSDDPDVYPAFVGSALDHLIAQSVARMVPDVRTDVTTVVTLPSGASYTGHPDLVFPKGVLDVKTVDGLTKPRRQGPNVQQQFQRHLYAAGLVQEGRLPEDCWVGNAWFDRSARESEPHVQVESYDPTWLHHADEWLSDVFYAVKTGEEAPKDKPVEWCMKCCEFASNCRAPDLLSDREHGGLIEDPELLDMIDAYNEASEMAKAAERMKDDAKRALAGTSGATGTHIVKWIYVNESQIPGFTRPGYERLSIRPIPRGAR
jgi:hypothetical protein